jgi:GT2 family glycosyltransferase
MPQFDVIVPHYGIDDRLNDICIACLDSVREHSEDYRLILVDNGTADTVPIDAALSKHRHVLLLRRQENLGFVKAVNLGLRNATAPYVVLLNNDTLVDRDWLPKLRGGLGGRAGMCGPLSTAEISWQGRWTPTGTDYHTLAAGRMLAFFCTMFTRALLDKLGGLDEAYGLGLGDDDDYCRRAQAAGFDLVLAQHLLIVHLHRTTFGALFSPSEIAELQRRALLRFHLGGTRFQRRIGAALGGNRYRLICGHIVNVARTEKTIACPECVAAYLAAKERTK